jgi:uncharacterized protein YcbX
MLSVKPCSRCGVVCVDQETGWTEPEPLRTLQKSRSGEMLAETQPLFRQHPEWKRKAFFMWNLVATAEGVLCVGDEVHINALRPN